MAEQFNDNQKFTGVRLPADVIPVHYDLSLKPDFKNFTFDGTVKIDFTKSDNKPIDEIVLNVAEIEIKEGYASTGSGENISITKVTYSEDTEAATLKFSNPITDKGYVFLKFSGILNDKLKGFYRTSYKVNDELIYAAATQFEATDARRCFPCWDEPAVKATFTVTLAIQERLVVGGKEFKRSALSNMSEAVTTPIQGTDEVEIKFNPTPKMSTYLLAFVVGPFDHIEAFDGKRKIRVYTSPGKSEQGRFALGTAVESLRYYEDYFGIEFPLDKMDLIALPDFASGAMENWGLVTYRETALLVDSNNTSTLSRQYVALVVAHELAHQWFGNLVTMEWWTHLWLNEGFASFMEYLCVDHMFPEFNIWNQFATSDYDRGLNLDALHSSHPIEVPVKRASEIREIFDAISYSKGASVIRMLHNYIGDECFRKGMNSYLNKFAYKNAFTEDLWASLEEASNKPVGKIMSGWTLKKGFPWLSVECSKEGKTTKLVLTQTKFSSDGKLPPEDVDNSWIIPISAMCGSNPSKVIDLGLLEGRTGEFLIDNPNDDWVKLNPGSIGFYRTAYPKAMASKLLPIISNRTLPALDRQSLQSDFFALCSAGKVSTVELLTLLKAYKEETNFTAWKSIDNCVGTLNGLLSHTDYQDKYQSFGRDLYASIFKKLSWTPVEGEKSDDAMTRALVINRLVGFNDLAVIEEAKSKYRAHLDKTCVIAADLRGAVYKAISTHGDDQAFESLFVIYRTADSNEERNRIAVALARATDVTRQKRVIDLALSDEVRDQDKMFFLMPLGATNPTMVWKLFQDKKDFLRNKFESGNLMVSIVKSATENFVTEEKAIEITKFFQDNKFPGTERAVQQSLETIRINSAWLARDRESVKSYLS